jgi:transcriptional regulator with XRE-family HTH domain
MASQHFDVAGFLAALNGVRRSRNLTWRQVALAADVSPSSLTRMAKGSRPDIDTIASLASWASLSPAAFFPRNDAESPLSMVTAYIHRDPDLTPEAASALEQLVRTTYSQLARTDDEHRRQLP